jgi:hypothetical protein
MKRGSAAPKPSPPQYGYAAAPAMVAGVPYVYMPVAAQVPYAVAAPFYMPPQAQSCFTQAQVQPQQLQAQQVVPVHPAPSETPTNAPPASIQQEVVEHRHCSTPCRSTKSAACSGRCASKHQLAPTTTATTTAAEPAADSASNSLPELITSSSNRKSDVVSVAPGQVVFYINGKQHVVANPDPKALLNDYIRSQPGLCGTKHTCGEVSDRSNHARPTYLQVVCDAVRSF